MFLLPVENPGVKSSRVVLIRKYCELHPEDVFTILSTIRITLLLIA